MPTDSLTVPLACGASLSFEVGDLRPSLEVEVRAAMAGHLDCCVVCTATLIAAGCRSDYVPSASFVRNPPPAPRDEGCVLAATATG